MKKKWSEEEVIALSKEFRNYREMHKSYGGAINHAVKNKYVHKLTFIEKPRNRWTKESCIKESRNHTLGEFRDKCPGAYNHAVRNEYKDQLECKQPRNRRWNHEDAIKEASKYNSVNAFRKDSRGAYDYAKRHGLLNQLEFLEKEEKIAWTKESFLEVANGYKHRTDLRKNNNSAYTFGKKNNLLNVAFPEKVYSFEECLEEAKKYGTINKLKSVNGHCYRVMRKNGWNKKIVEILNHIDLKHVIETAKKYKGWGKFKSSNKKLVTWMTKEGISREDLARKAGWADKTAIDDYKDLSWIDNKVGLGFDEWKDALGELYGIPLNVPVGTPLALIRFFEYIRDKHPNAKTLNLALNGSIGGINSSSFIKHLTNDRATSENTAKAYSNKIKRILDDVIKSFFMIENDLGVPMPMYVNTFNKTRRKNNNLNESNKIAMPYRYIQGLRKALTGYDDKGDKPWVGKSFSDWSVRDLYLPKAVWFDVDESVIDKNDPDCVWRENPAKSNNSLQMYSPVAAVALLVKLHLPLRTHQVRFLDSGEADTFRYVNGSYILNTKHTFVKGTEKRPFSKGVFRKTYDSFAERYSTSIFISTNKTQDRNKNELDRGYPIPWEHEEVLYWLEKLRNWQEKYNPIHKPLSVSTLSIKHLNAKPDQKKDMGDICFLFRSFKEASPITDGQVSHVWKVLLKDFEIKHANKENNVIFIDPSNGKPIFPLHSLRVSLITAYLNDGNLPLTVVSKLLAGHSRILMTVYYNKVSPFVMREKMKEAVIELEKNADESLKRFITESSFKNIEQNCVFDVEGSTTPRSLFDNHKNAVGLIEVPLGLCLAGGGGAGEATSDGSYFGCHNGGPEVGKARIHSPVPGGAMNCTRCRFFITDATYLEKLNGKFNYESYMASECGRKVAELENAIELIENEKYDLEMDGKPFLRGNELNALHSRHESALSDANNHILNLESVLTIIRRLIEIERSRDANDTNQKIVANGDRQSLQESVRFIETKSELLQLASICENAEIYPDLRDEVEKSPVVQKRTMILSKMMSKAGFNPIFLQMDSEAQLIAGNALIRKMALAADPNDHLSGMTKVANYIEAEDYLTNTALLQIGCDSLLEECSDLLPFDTSKPIKLNKLLQGE